MFVQEEKIFAGKVLRLHICASDGSEWLEEATEDTSVEKLKERCLKHVSPGRSAGPPSRPSPGGGCVCSPFPRPPRSRPTDPSWAPLLETGPGLSASYFCHSPGGRSRAGN